MKPFAFVALMAVCSPSIAQGGGDMTPDSVDVVEAASAVGQLDELLAAVLDAGLAETLAQSKDVTVLAPIDAAFESLPEKDALRGDKSRLAQVLKYHVIPKTYLVADIPAGDTQVTTLSGQTLTLTNDAGSITITTPSGIKAMVVQQDIKSDNGVVHAINKVLMP